MDVGQGDGTRCTAYVEPGTTRLLVRCTAADGTHRWQRVLDGGGETAFTARDSGRLYVVSYPVSASGCRVVAMSEGDGTILWERTLEGPSPVLHSKYGNEVWLVPTRDGLRVEGRESAGSYMELLDTLTGTTLARLVKTP